MAVSVQGTLAPTEKARGWEWEPLAGGHIPGLWVGAEVSGGREQHRGRWVGWNGPSLARKAWAQDGRGCEGRGRLRGAVRELYTAQVKGA